MPLPDSGSFAVRRLALALALVLVALPVGASAPEPFPYLEFDFLTSGPGLRPASTTWVMEQRYVKLGGFWYFPADDGMHGRELWRSDGTTGGTTMVRDLCPGLCSGSPSSLVAFGNELLFAAWDGEHGVELWRSDGTASGTTMVADLVPGPVSSVPYQLRVQGSVVLFSAITETEGREPWRTDGTSGGTFQLADINPGPDSSSPGVTYSAGALAVFSATDGQGSIELYRTDGTVAGTQKVLAFPSGRVDYGYEAGPNRWVSWNGYVYFPAELSSEWELWRSDGTASGTQPVTDFAPNSPSVSWLTVSQGKLFFSADGGTGRNLWSTDGTSSGTTLVKDFMSGLSGGNPWYLIDSPAGLLFIARQPATSYALWRSDGTEAGTVLVKEIVPGTGSAHLTLTLLYAQWEWQRVADKVLFLVEQPNGSTERWVTDGTSAGTVKLADAAPADDTPVHRQTFASIEPEVILLEGSVRQPTLLRTDGEVISGVAQIDSYSSSYPHRLAAIDDRVYVRSTDGGGPPFVRSWIRELGGSVSALGDLAPVIDNLLDFSSSVPMLANERLYFTSSADPDEGESLYSTDSYFGSLSKVPSALPSRNSRPFVFDDALHFWGDPDPNDGTGSSALLRVVDPASVPEEIPVSSPFFLGASWEPVELGGRLYLPSFEGLWSIDAQATGLDHAPGTSLSTDLYPLGSAFGTAIGFSAEESSTGREVRTMDPATGTLTLHEVRPGPDSGALGRQWIRAPFFAEATFPASEVQSPAAAAASAGSLYFFVGNDGLSGSELWATTAAGPPFLVRDIAPGAASSFPAALQSAGGLVFFRANDGAHGSELWVSDGTEAGTQMLGDLRAGAESSLPQELTEVDGFLLFSAYEESHGRELWISDGTSAGTRRLADIAPGPGSSSPLSLLPHDDAVLFVANDGVSGFELWALDRPLVNDSDLLFATGFEGANLSSWAEELD